MIELEQEETAGNQQKLENKGSVSIDGGYSQDGGWHVGGSVSVSWARQQERRKIIEQLALLEADMYEIQPSENKEPTTTISRVSPNKGSAHIDGGYSQDDGWHLDGGIEYSWAKKQANFAIPSWVISTLKFLLEEVIKDVICKYRVEVSWEPNYEEQYKACIISLVNIDKEQSINDVSMEFVEHVRSSIGKVIGNKFPVHLKFEKYNGNPSAIIYW